MRFLVLLVSLSLFLASSRAAPAADEITSLPLWSGELPSKQYSGYLQISDSKFLHYWFIESQNDPSSDPVTLWLNGGPGCSSLDGFIYEHGPFRLNDDATKLQRFEYTWANKANMLYLEAPVGVGFSYSTDSKDYNCTDDTTAQDNLHAIEKFFELFPEYNKHDLILTGESYAGVYIPTLAEAIVKANQQGTYKGAPLKAIAVGNGCTGTEIGVCGGQRDIFMTQYLMQTAFVNNTLKKSLTSNCDFDSGHIDPASKCGLLIADLLANLGKIDIYNIYGTCISSSDDSNSAVFKAPWALDMPGPVPCIDSIRASSYFNRPEVQSAIHVKKPDHTWAVCTTSPGWKYTSTRPNLPRDTYPLLVENLRVVIYNGDWDSCVPYTDNEAWTSGMGLDVDAPWHPWTYSTTFENRTTEQVAGYATRYANGNFTFITIRGGRHEVPETAPEQAYEMLDRLVNNKPF